MNGEIIPLQSLTEWYIYYQIMGRAEKIKYIEQYKEQNNKK